MHSMDIYRQDDNDPEDVQHCLNVVGSDIGKNRG